MKKASFIISLAALILSIINLYNAVNGLGGGLKRRESTVEKE